MNITGPPWWPAEEYRSRLNHSGLRAAGAKYRQQLCYKNPLVFGLIYFSDTLLSSPDGSVHLSDLHCDIAREAKRWTQRDLRPTEERHAIIAPRGSAKSTWADIILPAWALAFGHRRFVALFGSTRKQITTTHFATLLNHIDSNDLLRHDFPTFTRKLAGAGTKTSDTFRSANGTSIVARGIDETNLGLNINGLRPDLIVIDDPEPDEGNFTEAGKEKRLASIRQGLLGMNPRAVVQWVGTTVAYNCLAHDLVRAATGEHTAQWIAETGFTARHYPAIIHDEMGERSLWPEVWDIDWLRSERGRRDFELNYQNRPPSATGTLWEQRHFNYDIPRSWAPERRIMWIDPAVTSKATSDYTGICVATLCTAGRVIVDHAAGVRVSPEGLKRNVLAALSRYPDLREIYVEDNNGKDYLRHALQGLPAGVRLKTSGSDTSKMTRFGKAFTHYERGRVRHAGQFRLAEDQMMAFPHGKHDDVADAVSAAVNQLLLHVTSLAPA